MQTGGNIKSPSFLLFCCYFLVFLVAWSLPNISANHLFERLVTANIIFNLFTSFFAIHYYKISKYACKSTIIVSEKGKIFSKCLRDMQIVEYFAILFLSFWGFLILLFLICFFRHFTFLIGVDYQHVTGNQ